VELIAASGSQREIMRRGRTREVRLKLTLAWNLANRDAALQRTLQVPFVRSETGSSRFLARHFISPAPRARSQRPICFSEFVSRGTTMSRIFNVVLNLSIGVKLGITSALAVLLVSGMLVSQLHGNATGRELDANKLDQQTIARDAVDAKASIRGMQIGVRDIRLAGSAADFQKANEYLASRLSSVNKFADEMLKLSHSAENRARIEKLKTRAQDYAKEAQQIASVRSQAIAIGAGEPDAAGKVTKLNEEAVRIAREVTLPIAGEIEGLANQIADFAKHKVDETNAEAAREMASAERTSLIVAAATILLLIGTWAFSFFTIGRPMRALSVSMEELAGGNFAVVLPGLGRKDELGQVAGAVEKFKIVAEQKARDEAEAKRRQDEIAA
jgi:HAMP domain-containing protein